jgi:hypothetical protein
MKIYQRGNLFPPEITAKMSGEGLKKYWLLSPDGTPDPSCKPFMRKWEIELAHKQTGEPYRIITGKRGRSKGDKDKYKAYRERVAADPVKAEERRRKDTERKRQLRGNK